MLLVGRALPVLRVFWPRGQLVGETHSSLNGWVVSSARVWATLRSRWSGFPALEWGKDDGLLIGQPIAQKLHLQCMEVLRKINVLCIPSIFVKNPKKSSFRVGFFENFGWVFLKKPSGFLTGFLIVPTLAQTYFQNLEKPKMIRYNYTRRFKICYKKFNINLKCTWLI